MWDVLCDCFTGNAGEDFIGPRSSTADSKALWVHRQ
jgi:hypothetical protein